MHTSIDPGKPAMKFRPMMLGWMIVCISGMQSFMHSGDRHQFGNEKMIVFHIVTAAIPLLLFIADLVFYDKDKSRPLAYAGLVLSALLTVMPLVLYYQLIVFRASVMDANTATAAEQSTMCPMDAGNGTKLISVKSDGLAMHLVYAVSGASTGEFVAMKEIHQDETIARLYADPELAKPFKVGLVYNVDYIDDARVNLLHVTVNNAAIDGYEKRHGLPRR